MQLGRRSRDLECSYFLLPSFSNCSSRLEGCVINIIIKLAGKYTRALNIKQDYLRIRRERKKSKKDNSSEQAPVYLSSHMPWKFLFISITFTQFLSSLQRQLLTQIMIRVMDAISDVRLALFSDVGCNGTSAVFINQLWEDCIWGLLFFDGILLSLLSRKIPLPCPFVDFPLLFRNLFTHVSFLIGFIHAFLGLAWAFKIF